jgi:hypothetical protein
MASEKHKTAKRSRDTAKKERKALVQDRKDARKQGKTAKVKSLTRQIMKKSSDMRTAGDTMRDETGREKGQRTTYTGPSKQKTIRLIRKTTGDKLPGPTDWQNVNTKWLDDIMKANPKYRLSDARLHLKDMFAKDRAGYLKEQQSRYDTKKFATFTPTGKIKDVSASGKVLSGKPSAAGLGDVMLQTPYTRPAPKDWSNLRYTYAGSPESELGQVTQTPASRAMFGNQGRALQPWTGGQGVHASLLNYQVPGGAGFDVTYSGANPSLFDFNQQQNNQQQQQQQQQQNLMALNQSNLAANQAMYPQHSQQAAAKGLVYRTPAYNEWIAANKQGMAAQGMDISGNKFGGDRYTSQNWIDYQKGLLADQEAQNGKTAALAQVVNIPGKNV